MAVGYTTTIGGKTYGFDWRNQVIEIDALTDSVSATELKAAIHDAQYSEVGASEARIMETGNPFNLVTGVSATAQNVGLLDGWKILTLKTTGSFVVVGGNTVSINDGVLIFASNPTVDTTNILETNGVQVETGVSGLTPTEAAQLALIDTINTLVDELHEIRGLNATRPVTITRNSDDDHDMESANVDLKITKAGDVETVQRQ